MEDKKRDEVTLTPKKRKNNVNSVDFNIILWAVFLPAYPKNAKKTVKSSVSLVLLGSLNTKDACKMLVELSLGVNFNIILQAAFAPVDLIASYWNKA